MSTATPPEGTTPLDPDEADGLLLTHITTRGELDRWEQDNILEALAWLAGVKSADILTEQFARQLHKRMFSNVWRWAGQLRRTDKNIGVPWAQVAVSVRNLFDDTRLWLELKSEPSDTITARFHHRLVCVHPFPNGNGRHARLMTDLLLERNLNRTRFTWGGQTLADVGDARSRYITGLRAADGGDYCQLVAFARS